MSIVESRFESRKVNSIYERIGRGDGCVEVEVTNAGQATQVLSIARDCKHSPTHKKSEDYWSIVISRPERSRPVFRFLPLITDSDQSPCNGCSSRNWCREHHLACGAFHTFVMMSPPKKFAKATWDVPCASLYKKIFNGGTGEDE